MTDEAGRHLRPQTGPVMPEPRWWWRSSLRRYGNWGRGHVSAVIVTAVIWFGLLGSVIGWWRTGQWPLMAWQVFLAITCVVGWVVYLRLPVRPDQ